MILMVRIKRFTAALLVVLFAAALVPQTQVNAASAKSTEIKVYNYLVGKLGFNTAATCGLMANIKHESGFNISGTGDGNTSYGLFQWHAGRKSRLISYCKEKKLNYKSVEGQLTYFNYELKKSYKKVYEYLKSVENNASGAYRAGYYFCYYYEIPANRSVKAANRGALARDTYWKTYSKSGGKQIETEEKVSTDTSDSKVAFTRTLQLKTKRMKGNDVKYMQQCLKKLGYKITVDGSYGKGTVEIVKKYQKAQNSKVDGKISKSTWKAIEKKAAAVSAASTSAVKITEQPQAVTTNAGKYVTFSVKASGKGLSYQWYTKKAGASEWTLWPGHDTASTKAKANDSWDGMQVRCTVKDSSGKKVNSKAAKITISDPLEITQQPKSVTINCSDTVKFSVKATGKNLSYQWYVKKTDADTWTQWPGHDTASTSAISNTSWNGMQVRCVVTDGSGSTVTSKAAKITLNGDEVAVG